MDRQSTRKSQPIVTGCAAAAGSLAAVRGVVSYARFVVLDAQGLVTVRRRTKAKRAKQAASRQNGLPANRRIDGGVKSTPAAAVSISRETVQPVKTPADSSRWVDGSRFEREHYDADEDEEIVGRRPQAQQVGPQEAAEDENAGPCGVAAADAGWMLRCWMSGYWMLDISNILNV